MDELDPAVFEAQTMQPRHTVTSQFARGNGLLQLDTRIIVTCADTHDVRREMVELLRALADDIEVGVA